MSTVRRLWPLTLRGTGALVLAVASFVIAQRAGIPELLYFGTLMLALLATSAGVLWLTRGAGEVTRTVVPEVAEVGGAATVVVRTRRRTALPASAGRWRDALPAGLSGRAEGPFPAVASSLAGSDGAVELRYEVRGTARGTHRLGPLELTTTDPFGLVRRRLRLGRPTALTVAPPILDLAPLPPSSGEAGGRRHSAALQLGQGADNLVARPYAPGDSMRRIHWRATAHRDTLMVRQEEQESSPSATVVFDRAAARWAPAAAATAGADAAFETAVTVCVSAVARLVHEGFTVDVVDSDGALLIDPIEGGDDVEARAAAALFATVTTRADHASRRVLPAAAAASSGPLVVVTGALQPDDRAGLAAAGPRSSLAVLIVVDDVADLDTVRRAGWRAGGVRPGDDPVPVWDAAMEQGYARVG